MEHPTTSIILVVQIVASIMIIGIIAWAIVFIKMYNNNNKQNETNGNYTKQNYK